MLWLEVLPREWDKLAVSSTRNTCTVLASTYSCYAVYVREPGLDITEVAEMHTLVSATAIKQAVADGWTANLCDGHIRSSID